MIRFECDYAEGTHIKILKALENTNFEQTQGYGEDKYCEEASEIIKNLCSCKKAQVHFLVGGTQTNKTVIASVLKPYEAVICTVMGHINESETGAIEATGHKILTVPSKDGKILPKQIKEVCSNHYNNYHKVKPAMVFISNPTEIGTIYSKKELLDISETCKNLNLKLYVDGARLGYGLTSEENDLTLEDIAKFCDVFYIGGTKIGALFGEAVVIVNENLQENFKYFMKQNGALLAKGRILGIQFKTLFEDNLYFEISSHANKLAKKIKEAFREINCNFLVNSPTNLQFPILHKEILNELSKKYTFLNFKNIDEDLTAVRFVTSWATKEENVDELVSDVLKLK